MLHRRRLPLSASLRLFRLFSVALSLLLSLSVVSAATAATTTTGPARDAAVAAAYGFPADLTDEAILERLLELNADSA